MPAEKILALVGPTAVGKTAYSLAWATQHNAEIISADSRQIYKRLDIGTAKPCPEELRQVPHHFIDELDLDEPFSAGQFAEAANARIRDILARDKTPLVVGGSTLYIQALIEGLADIPPIPSHIREALNQRCATEGPAALYDELVAVDPTFAQTLDRTKSQRIIRGLEVYIGTGQPLSHFHQNQRPPPFTFDVRVLSRDRAVLYERINTRVDIMLDAGLIAEVETLLVQGVSPTCNALQTIGYQEPIAYLQGNIDHTEMVRLLKRNTRRYAKRQLTWFRRFPEPCWVNL